MQSYILTYSRVRKEGTFDSYGGLGGLGDYNFCVRGNHRRVRLLGLVVRRSAGKRKDADSTPLFGSPFSSKIVIYGPCLVTVPCAINETLKWLTSLPI